MTATADPKSHYYVQRNRRAAHIDEWRGVRRELRRGHDVSLIESPVRGMRLGMLAGPGTPMPARTIDARLLEIDAASTTSTHRHTHDAVLFVLSGHGSSRIAGQQVEWGPRDALHTPAWTWHSHSADEGSPARLFAVTDAPLLRALGLSWVQDIGRAQRSDEVPTLPPGGGDDPSGYGEDLRQANTGVDASGRNRVHTAWTEVTLRQNPKGTKTALLVDSGLGYRTSGLSMALFEIPPGHAQSNHRHPGEAYLYIVSGTGYSIVDGKRYDWSAGDIVMVHQYVWHQHVNADLNYPAVVLRIHMWETLIDLMQCAMDPIPLYEDDPRMLEATQEGGVWVQSAAEIGHPSPRRA